jgi:Mg-chelatase subunit ChlI
MEILERNVAFESDPEGFSAEWEPREHELSQEIARARELVEQVRYDRRNLATIAGLTAGMHVDGHRADLVILKAARAHAALEARTTINERDVLLAAELALPHRLKRQPFQEADVSLAQLEERLEQLSSEYAVKDGEPDPSAPPAPVKKKR